jgi:hypothetical protein
MAGDGPHYSPPYPSPLHRNSSYALATLRPDGFVALSPKTGAAAGRATTVPLLVSGPRLLVTADAAPSGTVRVSVRSAGAAGSTTTLECVALSGRNVTDEALDGCDLDGLVGQMATLELQLEDAALYIVGFGSRGDR